MAEKRTRCFQRHAEKYLRSPPDAAFFHWELDMRDAFTDTRRGFDVIVGNPPWDSILPYDDEFFTPFYPPFRSLSPKPKKDKKKKRYTKK